MLFNFENLLFVLLPLIHALNYLKLSTFDESNARRLNLLILVNFSWIHSLPSSEAQAVVLHAFL